MLTFALSLFILHLITSTTTDASSPYTPTDYFLLDCGSSSSSTSADNRTWDGDARSKFSPPNIANTSSPSTAEEQNPAVTQVPFMTARLFPSQFTYTFPVSAGPKFLRLYFYPATYSGRDNSKSFFSVTAGSHTLLTNFSAFLTATGTAPQQSFLIKEFVISVNYNQRLDIKFDPSPNSYAFINGIEIVSMPNNLYIRGPDYPIPQVSQQQPFTIDNTTALETLYRLNVGGNLVPGKDDTGMYRIWRQDDPYIYGQGFGLTPHRDITIRYTNDTPEYTAPATVYTTLRTMGKDNSVNLNYNLTWIFTVDSGFRYLFRLHFCEILQEVTRVNQRVFTVFLNNQTADPEVDVIQLSGDNGVPIFKDYVVWVPLGDGRRSKQDLWLALYPNMDSIPKYTDAILNGLEIFKLNQSDGSLAGPNPEPVGTTPEAPYPKSPEKEDSGASSPVLAVVGGVIGGVLVVAVMGVLIFRRRRRVRDSGPSVAKSSWVPISVTAGTSTSTKTNASSLPSDLCRHFSISEIRSATRNFTDDFMIGTGGFGNVYKGYIDGGATTVAIKRLDSKSNQGAREFQTEIGMLSKLRHLHLVSLIGYCDDDGEMILVYDYMANGTLRDHLYKTENPPLSWKNRLQICLGAARGLHYLHTGAKHMIIHRDVKSTNILLDDKWVAKVSDFGLSKTGPDNVAQTHVTTVVKGSFGYVDPEYYRRQQLTEKSDVYSFGVVLLEVLCARPAIVTGLPKEQVSLAVWGRYCMRKGTIDQIVDPHLMGQIAPECLRKFGEIVDSCLRDEGIQRPTMSDVVWGLEFAIQLQDAAERNKISGGDWIGIVGCHTMLSPATDDDVFSGSKSSGTSTLESGRRSENSYAAEGVGSENVFSQIVDPKGR
ncbi:malectin/receptor-like protein kinase family protein [Actinidia rufa]|uniref:Malectin/receptor-like protein kinase family protein n=1 Tax=Actinidia rufa TaxID=165716 RepID=A0A7J0D9N6_9ERIC|nr:malectin/receptor-like protein kinase family protein [Actinidia rufa]